MPTMRRLLPCLILLPFLLVVAHASNAMADKQHSDCAYNDATDMDEAQIRPATAPRAHAATDKPSASDGGGGDLMPHLRMPKWHSFLPGMFR
ncbi:hypothetical protein XACN24_00910 [Xanthomonas albilineans]|nr:hypothetical protein [Xanthomonas albilineans]QHQ26989.1 hypothetical protein XaFJ1_GM000227 [Xanthomonas albilineans]